MATGHQKVDHGGKYFATPRRLVDSAAWRQLSAKAAKVLAVFQSRHNGFNNGKIALSIHAISTALGNQNHAGTAKAVVELIQKGFLECTSDADRRHAKAREYRLTFISTGEPKRGRPATNDYLEWQPPKGHRRKFGGARFASTNGKFPEQTASAGKVSGIVSSPSGVEIPRISVGNMSEETALLIGSQGRGSDSDAEISTGKPRHSSNLGWGLAQDELRRWLQAVLAQLGHGGQKDLSDRSGVPQAIICKFKNGRGLPAHYQLDLQAACGRVYSFKEWKESLEACRGEAANFDDC